MPKSQLEYFSKGFIKAGEPSDILEYSASYLLLQKPVGSLSSEEHGRLIDAFNYSRIHELQKSFPRDMGYAFDEQITQGEFVGAYRHWLRSGSSQALNQMENNLITLLGVLLSFAGFFGFVLEYRLRERLM